MADALYFGCWGGPGHFLVAPNGRHASCPAWQEFELDAKLCPGYVGAYTTPNSAQVEGAAALYHKDGWTALAFWDRSVDTRGGCNSVLLLRGTHFGAEVVRLAQEAFPSIWKRFRFEVKVGTIVIYSPAAPLAP